MSLMESRFKYPRTPHLPWSPGFTDDDIRSCATDHFVGKEVVVTEKMDGENTTLYRDYLHARSIEGRHHPSRDWLKRQHAAFQHEIPAGWRLCGENLYARHSIAYRDLPGYFFLFSIWNEHNCCLGWDETLEWAAILNLPTPRILFRGRWDEAAIRRIKVNEAIMEGYVVRTVAGFPHAEFSRHVAKWVRVNHVQTDDHWMNQAVVPNGLRGDGDATLA